MVKLIKKLKGCKITDERISELLQMSDDELRSDLEDGLLVLADYYNNPFYLNKYINDKSFMKTGPMIMLENKGIQMILDYRQRAKAKSVGSV